jgi:hypothetical protein
VTADGKRYLIGIFTKSDWVANVRSDPKATLARGRRVENVRLVELGPEDRGPIMRAYPGEMPHGTFVFVKAWTRTLSHKRIRKGCRRITENVLRHFLTARVMPDRVG